MTGAVHLRAPAKVNLYLRVVRKRPDGYHELDTLFQAIDLCDELTLELGGAGVELRVEGADLEPTEENLAYRAARRLLASGGLDVGLRIGLRKRIPVGAGLGGGSSDAAAVLRGLSLLVDALGDEQRLRAVGAELGSDVSFFLGGSPLARGRGRGEVLEPLAPLPVADLVLVSPPVHSSTAVAYRELDRMRLDGGSHPVTRTPAHPSSWKDVEAFADNDFEPLIARRHPEVRRALEALSAAGASIVMLSGSGAASFGLFPDRASAERVAAELVRRLGWPCAAVRTLETFPSPRPG